MRVGEERLVHVRLAEHLEGARGVPGAVGPPRPVEEAQGRAVPRDVRRRRPERVLQVLERGAELAALLVEVREPEPEP